MTPQELLAARAAGLTPERRQALLPIGAFHRQRGHVFSRSERERLRFLRWLYQTGRLAS